MDTTIQIPQIKQIKLADDGIFPNSPLPVLFYKGVLAITSVFPAVHVQNLFEGHHWTNSWDSGLYTYHHYHSVTHEVLGVYSGKTTLLLGGENGVILKIEQGDVLVIPAGVAHKNLGDKNDATCVGAYPDGRDYDMNYGKSGERPRTDKNVRNVPLPSADPVYGRIGGLTNIWDDPQGYII